MTSQGIKAGQTAVIGGQTVRFTTASPSMMAGANQVTCFKTGVLNYAAVKD